MNRKIVILLLAAILLLEGVSSWLLADETHEYTETSICEIAEPLSPDTPPTPSGIGNGGGNPG